MSAIINFLKLIRVFNCLLTAAGVIVGAFLTWLIPRSYDPLLAALAAFLVCAAGNVVNDIVDVNIDRINRPERMLVTGDISRPVAVKLALGLTVLSIIVAWSINVDVLITVILAIVLLALYNFRVKKIPFAGNIVIAILGGLTFIVGGLAVDRLLTFTLPGPLIPAVFAVLFHLSREILKDVEDIEGDRRVGVKTLPQIIGVSRALLVALALFFILAVFTFIPVLTGWYGTTYKIIAIYIIDLPTLLLLILIWGNPSPKMLRAGSLALKIGMVLGILALVLAG